MTLETFFDKFDLFADAPGAVGKMRELVLELAVRGKLVEREATGESLTEAQRHGGERAEDEMPYPLPAGWRWEALGTVARLRRGYDLPTQARKPGSIPIFAANGPVGVHESHMVKGPGVVTGRSGSIGKVHFVEEDYWPLNTALFVEDFFGNYPQFICLLLRSLHLEQYSTATAVPTLNRNVVHRELVRVPPLTEQKRIVAKVDELMALCDRLEAQQQEREQKKAALARASLARFADAPTPAHLDMLFYPPPCPRASVRKSGEVSHRGTKAQSPSSFLVTPADLRKSILILAVQGKLVPQDPNDEPAAISADSHFNGPFDIPEKWSWVHLADLQPEFQNGASSRGDKDGIPVIVIRLADVASRRISLNNPRAIPISKDQIAKYRLEFGDTLITRVNGSADIVGTFIPVLESLNAIYCDHFIRMRIGQERLYPAYTALVGASQLVREQISNLFITTAGQKTVNQGHIRSLSIPLPPLAEQRRIVAKLDELMALVDELETQLASARSAAANLLTALVAELTAGKESHAAA